MRIKQTSALSLINLSEGDKVPTELQILRVGNFNHPRYGKFQITPQTLSEMKTNFDERVRGIDLAFDYFHESDKEASGWVRALELKENGTELWAHVDWTPKAAQKLSERELRYFSPDFAFNWQDPETGVTFKNVLFGGGLTNRPFVKEMQAIVADEKQTGENDMTELEKALARAKELEAQNVKLSEEKAAMEKQLAAVPPANEASEVEALKKQIAELQAMLAKAEADSQAALAEKAKSDEAAKLAEKTSQFNVLLSEGKACAAQKDAFLKGDMTEFVKLAQPLNLKASGSGNSNDGTATEPDVEAIIKLAEEKQKANSKLSRHDAISLAKKELKK